jgi:cation diffusion facilitator family transporter
MHEHASATNDCIARQAQAPHKRERGVQLVVLLTAAMMVIEIAVGYATHSMALLADGWHMATHVGALGLASAAYWVSRRFATHRAFAFGTGKVRALAGYTSAVALGLVALSMVTESIERLVNPHAIDFGSSLPVAVLGLVVNLASVFLLHSHDDHDGHHHDHAHAEGHEHHHDHNHRAAFMHVVADAFTSLLAIGALLAGRYLNWTWLDAASGIVGGIVILNWGAGLLRNAAFELLDVSQSSAIEDNIRSTLESLDDVRVRDLHVWSLGGGAKSCVVTLVTSAPREARTYREALSQFSLAHLTIEVQRCEHGHGQAVSS